MTGSDGRIYAIGGAPSGGSYPNPTAEVDAYNVYTNTWTQVASLPTARYGLAAAAGPDGRIYAVSGFNGNANTPSATGEVDAYDIPTNTWTRVADCPIVGNHLAAATGTNGTIYAIGGSNNVTINTVDAYNVYTNTWTQVASLPVARTDGAAVTGHDGRIYVMGGSDYVGGGIFDNPITETDVYNPTTNTWSQVASAPVSHEYTAAAVGPDGRIYLIAGYNNGPNNEVDAYTPAATITPTITWPSPANIVYGTQLSTAQLDAVATDPTTGNTIPGQFTYSVTATGQSAGGVVLHAGTGQSLSVTFTPTDTADYNTVTATASINVSKATPTITWAHPANITYGTALGATQLDATATGIDGNPLAGTFAYTPAAGTVLGAGQGQTLSATFTPTDTTDYTSGGNATATINVDKATPTTAVSSSSPSTTYGQSVTFTATVAAGAGTLTGTVDFLDNGTTIGTGSLDNTGQANFATSTLTAGSYPTITAVYGGDTNFTGSTSPAISQQVNQAATTTAVTSSANPSVYGQSVTFTATVSAIAPGAGTPTGTVTFEDGSTTLGTGTLSDGVATFSTSTLSVEAHVITAVYGGDSNFTTSTSPSLTQTFNRAATTTAVVSSANPSVYGQPLTFTATVTPSSGTVTPTGTVDFFDGSSRSRGEVISSAV